MKYGLSEETVSKIIGVFSRFKQVEEVILYGLRAKGNFKPGSDIDLTLKGEKLRLELLNKISIDIDDLLLPYSFDISIFHQITNPDLLEHIARIGIVFYKKERDGRMLYPGN